MRGGSVKRGFPEWFVKRSRGVPAPRTRARLSHAADGDAPGRAARVSWFRANRFSCLRNSVFSPFRRKTAYTATAHTSGTAGSTCGPDFGKLANDPFSTKEYYWLLAFFNRWIVNNFARAGSL